MAKQCTKFELDRLLRANNFYTDIKRAIYEYNASKPVRRYCVVISFVRLNELKGDSPILLSCFIVIYTSQITATQSSSEIHSAHKAHTTAARFSYADNIHSFIHFL